jgi:hypothetical protein
MKEPKVPSDQHLEVKIVDNKIVISLGIDTLRYVAESSDNLGRYHRDFNPDGIWKKVCDKKEFAKDVWYELTREEEDGTTIVHQMFDTAINNAIDNGTNGVEYREFV